MSSVGVIGQVLLVIGGLLTLISAIFLLGVLFRVIPGWVYEVPTEEVSHDTSYIVLPLWHFLLPLLGSVIILFAGFLFKAAAQDISTAMKVMSTSERE